MFDLGGERYAFHVAAIGGVSSCGSMRRVPGCPAAVLGLAEWRGALLTVLDLPRLLGHDTPGDLPCLVRLAPPLLHTAFFLPATVQLQELSAGPGDATPFHDGKPVRMLEPIALVRALEREMRVSD